MKCCNYSKLDLIRKGLLIEGGGNETIEFYASEIGAILEDEDIELYGEDDIVVDGPEPKEEQGTGNKEGKRRRRKQDAAETVTADSPSSDLSDRSVPSGSPSPSRVPALTSGADPAGTVTGAAPDPAAHAAGHPYAGPRLH